MKQSWLIAALSALPSALAGSAIVLSNCPFPLYLWSVSPGLTSSPHSVSTEFPYSEGFQSTGGISLKISTAPNISALYDGSALTQFQYTLDGDKVWYDLADTGGDIFAGKSVALVPSDTSCEAFEWQGGVGASRVASCGSGIDLRLTLC